MNHTDINRRLALAIGYRPEDVVVSGSIVNVIRRGQGYVDCITFDYRDARTIYPIAERYGVFPSPDKRGGAWHVKSGYFLVANHHCPRACIALAVIVAKERGLL